MESVPAARNSDMDPRPARPPLAAIQVPCLKGAKRFDSEHDCSRTEHRCYPGSRRSACIPCHQAKSRDELLARDLPIVSDENPDETNCTGLMMPDYWDYWPVTLLELAIAFLAISVALVSVA
jgi:hypothetical protein